MVEFVTIVPEAPEDQRVLLWSEDEKGQSKVVSRHAELSDVPDVESKEIFTFTVPTTLAKNGINKSRVPAVDCEGSPLWWGARISFMMSTHSVNRARGEGVFGQVSEWEGVSFRADDLMNVYFQGFCVERRREQYACISHRPTEGSLAGNIVLSAKIGDKFETGEFDLWIRLMSDPRLVCALTPLPDAGPKL